jgi:ATP-dependent protease HslVU (ClpYQ) peptidase subunit
VTTIAYRAGVIAADRQVDSWMNACKLFRLKDGSVLAGAGHFDEVIEVVAWFNAGCKEGTKPVLDDDPDNSTDFVLACPSGIAYWLTSPFLRRVEIKDPFYAIGSGAQVALGAMAAGATPKRAVEIACQFDQATGKGVNVMRVKR